MQIGWIVVFALFCTVAVMRAVITCVGPVSEQLMSALGMSYSTYGALAALPVVCVGVFCFVTPLLCKRMSANRAAFVIGIILCCGLAARTVSNTAMLFFGTILVGASVAMFNSLIPVMLRHFFMRHVTMALGLYTSALSLSNFFGVSLSVPLSHLGFGYVFAIGFWLVLMVPGSFAWLLSERKHRLDLHHQSSDTKVQWRDFLRLPIWSVILTMSLQGLSSYSFLAWFPSLFISQGISEFAAGNYLGVMLAMACLASAISSKAVVWCGGERQLSVILTVMTLVAMGMVLVGGVWTLFGCALIGIPNGARYSLAIFLTSKKANSLSEMLLLGSLAQGIGYTIAAIGPLACGLLYQGDGNWNYVMAFLAFTAVIWGWMSYYGFGNCRVFSNNRSNDSDT